MPSAEDYRKLAKLMFIKTALYAPIPVTAAQSGFSGKDMLSKLLGMGAIMTGVMGVDAMLSAAASSPVGEVPNTLAKGQAFQRMLETDPSLQRLEPQRVKSMFNVVYQYFPAGAAEPMTAAGLVGNLAQYDRVDHKTVQDLIKMQKDYSDMHMGSKKAPRGISDRVLDAVPALFMA